MRCRRWWPSHRAESDGFRGRGCGRPPDWAVSMVVTSSVRRVGHPSERGRPGPPAGVRVQSSRYSLDGRCEDSPFVGHRSQVLAERGHDHRCARPPVGTARIGTQRPPTCAGIGRSSRRRRADQLPCAPPAVTSRAKSTRPGISSGLQRNRMSGVFESEVRNASWSGAHFSASSESSDSSPCSAFRSRRRPGP